MSDEDDVYEIIPTRSLSCIPELYVARSCLRDSNGRRYDFWGLFCDKDLKRGDFIGMYSGQWTHAGDPFDFGTRYAIQLSYGMLVAPPGQRPDPHFYSLAMANEPHPAAMANSILHEWVFGREDVENIPINVRDTRFYGVGLVACEDIPKRTEIHWHYGSLYGPTRDYPVGSSCKMNSVNVHPPHVLGHKLPYDSVSPILDSPSNSSDSSSQEDPSYRSIIISKLLYPEWN